MQLEENFMEAIVASERVERWLDAVRAFKRAGGGTVSLMRARQAMREMVAALDSEAYVDEVRSGPPMGARRQRAVPAFTLHQPFVSTVVIFTQVPP